MHHIDNKSILSGAPTSKSGTAKTAWQNNIQTYTEAAYIDIALWNIVFVHNNKLPVLVLIDARHSHITIYISHIITAILPVII